MSATVQGKTYDEHTADAQNHAIEAEASWDRSDTDGFVTQWAHGISGQVARRNAEIAANGGVAEVPALFDAETGELVAAKLVQVYDRYSYSYKSKWIVLASDDPNSEAVKWINAFPARKRTMTKHGYTEGYVKAPAVAKTWAPPGSKGMSGLASVSVITARTDGGFSRNVEIVTTCRDYDG